MKIALAQIDTTVGDFGGNEAKLLAAYQRGLAAGAEIVVAPELATTGYPPRDLLLRRGFVRRNLEVLERLAAATGQAGFIVGFVGENPNRPGREVTNAVALLQNGRVLATRTKTLLPSYDVFDEDRYFEPAASNPPVEFNGRKVPWVAQLDMGDNTGGVSESTPYKPMTIARDSSGIGWYKGTTALLLDDPEGNTWIMKGFQVGLKPKYTYEQFVAAGQSQFKKLPPGWKLRVKKLEKDLVEKPEGGVATIMPDEFFNMYDKTGPGMMNYKP